ncbi:MAG: zinc ribbon domain-containing protein [Anaerolineae bacterium]|nr:zinc ribbon domain-containing protein [Thermoflexales bacterium]MCX7938798.1 zinc ribbon domain-containing protein [Thermoflexales bacterium]MDW8053441.1 zinc ribbon domain-containing protein [Anaerolineae bacterium]MDW8395275.1 zinc ribbon domain-containing protein [Anaerolineae bacterium]
MPLYEYRCSVCGHVFEQWFVSITRAQHARVQCPACASRRVRRKIAAPQRARTEGAAQASEEETPVAETRLFGRKELNEVIQQKKKQGLL